MNKIQEQILKNQATILLMLSEMDGNWNVDTLNSVQDRMDETKDVILGKNE